MAVLKCKMCGGDIALQPGKTFGTCEYCGSNMTFPKLEDERRAVAFNRGNHFRRMGEFDQALFIYESILRDNDQDAEAHWCCALCRFGIEYVEDPVSMEWIPTCHRASFDSILEDVDYQAAVRCSEGLTRRQYQKDAVRIAEVQKGILATSQNEQPYDVFICYKETAEDGDRTPDSVLAQEVYYQLTEQGLRVFFARITLEDKVGSQYEPVIFAALNSAKVMIVLGTKAEHLHAVWVKNEWSRFLALMKKDRSKVLLPCYRDMSPYELPEKIRGLQSYDMAKIGFMQDLVRGVRKLTGLEEKKSQPAAQAGSPVAGLLKLGSMELEEEDWDNAEKLFDQALAADPENAAGHLGKAMTRYHCKDLNTFHAYYVTHDCTKDPSVKWAKRYATGNVQEQFKKWELERIRYAREHHQKLLTERKTSISANAEEKIDQLKLQLEAQEAAVNDLQRKLQGAEGKKGALRDKMNVLEKRMKRAKKMTTVCWILPLVFLAAIMVIVYLSESRYVGDDYWQRDSSWLVEQMIMNGAAVYISSLLVCQIIRTIFFNQNGIYRKLTIVSTQMQNAHQPVQYLNQTLMESRGRLNYLQQQKNGATAAYARELHEIEAGLQAIQAADYDGQDVRLSKSEFLS